MNGPWLFGLERLKWQRELPVPFSYGIPVPPSPPLPLEPPHPRCLPWDPPVLRQIEFSSPNWMGERIRDLKESEVSGPSLKVWRTEFKTLKCLTYKGVAVCPETWSFHIVHLSFWSTKSELVFTVSLGLFLHPSSHKGLTTYNINPFWILLQCLSFYAEIYLPVTHPHWLDSALRSYTLKIAKLSREVRKPAGWEYQNLQSGGGSAVKTVWKHTIQVMMFKAEKWKKNLFSMIQIRVW